MKTFCLSFLKIHYLEFHEDTIKITVNEINPQMVLSQSKRSYWGKCNKAIEETLGNEDFCEENLVVKYHDIYFIDHHCNVLLHFVNESGETLSGDTVATIRV